MTLQVHFVHPFCLTKNYLLKSDDGPSYPPRGCTIPSDEGQREILSKRREIRKKRREIPTKRREIRTFGAPPSFSFLGAPHLLYACSPLPSEASLRDPPGGKVVISRLLLRDGWSDPSEGGKRSTRDMRRTKVAYASRSCWSPVGCFPSAPSGGDVSR